MGKMEQKHYNDTMEGLATLVGVGMIGFYWRWESYTAWAYLALHGTYGILWVTKSRIYPDKQWESETGLAYGLVILGAMALYWITPWLICAYRVEVPAWYLALCISLYAFGVFFHFASDMQ